MTVYIIIHTTDATYHRGEHYDLFSFFSHDIRLSRCTRLSLPRIRFPSPRSFPIPVSNNDPENKHQCESLTAHAYWLPASRSFEWWLTLLPAEMMKPVHNWNLTNDKTGHCVYYGHGSALALGARAPNGTAMVRLHLGKDALKVHQTRVGKWRALPKGKHSSVEINTVKADTFHIFARED